MSEQEYKVGDWIHLTGEGWENYYPHLFETTQKVLRLDEDGDVVFAALDSPNDGEETELVADTTEGAEYYARKTTAPLGFANGGYVSPEGAKATMDGIAAGGCVIPGDTAPLPKTMLPTDPPRVGKPYPTLDIRPFDERVAAVLNNVSELLVAKNASYGDSALNPLQVFAKSDPVEQLHVRIDDKISRIKRGTDYGEDTITDLIGYLVLLKIAKGNA